MQFSEHVNSMRRLLMHKSVLMIFCLLAVASVIAEENVRTWTSASGSTLEARYVGPKGMSVVLQKPDGKKLQIDLSRLSRDDRAYVKSLALKQYDEPPPPVENYKVPIGRVSPEIKCAKESQWSYRLYLPPGFNLSRKWPVMFVMSPGGGGADVLNRYLPGANKNGWVLALSVQSKNHFDQSDVAVSAMVDDVLAQHPIDMKRLYSSGFSGGARMAFNLAQQYKKKFAGILPCGAGGTRADLSKSTEIYGLCGSNCFNRWDMACTKKVLSNEFRLWFFPGNHDWAGPSEIADGMTWLNGRYLKRATMSNESIKSEKHRYVKGVLADIGVNIDADPERAYRLATALQSVLVQPYYRGPLVEYMQKLKAMPSIQSYARAEAAMHDLSEKYFATSIMDYRNNNCPEQLTEAANAVADKYGNLKISQTIRRMGGPTQIP
jgi:dienelactone hydrolase